MCRHLIFKYISQLEHKIEFQKNKILKIESTQLYEIRVLHSQKISIQFLLKNLSYHALTAITFKDSLDSFATRMNKVSGINFGYFQLEGLLSLKGFKCSEYNPQYFRILFIFDMVTNFPNH